MVVQEEQIAAIINKWGIPFAQAFGEFVRVATQQPDASADFIEADVSSKANNGPPRGFAVQELTASNNPRLYRRIQEIVAAQAAKPVEFVEFDPKIPAKHAGNRLRRAFKARGIKQADVARRLGVAPSVISRVFKHPERSRLQTIRNIADAAGVSLAELI